MGKMGVGGIITSFVVLLVAMVLIISVPFWLIWNWMMPEVFGLPPLTWVQTLGFLFLCGALFKSNVSSSK